MNRNVVRTLRLPQRKREERDLDRRNCVCQGLEELEHTRTQSARWGVVKEAAEVVRDHIMKPLGFFKTTLLRYN